MNVSVSERHRWAVVRNECVQVGWDKIKKQGVGSNLRANMEPICTMSFSQIVQERAFFRMGQDAQRALRKSKRETKNLESNEARKTM